MSEEQVESMTEVARQLAALPSLLVGTDDMDRVVWKTALLGVGASDRVDACGVTVLREGAPTSLMPEEAPYADLEQLQYEADDGPAMLAARTREPVLISSMRRETRFGDYPSYARSRDVGATLTLPMVAGEDVLGALTLYSETEHAFESDREVADLVVDLATTALAMMLQHAEQTELAAQLQQALESRAVIDQAKGMVMMQRRCTAEEAFAVLREVSQQRNIKLRDVAVSTVAALAGRGGT